MPVLRAKAAGAPVAAAIAATALALALWHAGAATPTGALVAWAVAIGAILAAAHRERSGQARGEALEADLARLAAMRARDAGEAERIVAAALDAIPDAILEVDGTRDILRANAAARDLMAASAGAPLLSVVRDPDILAGVDDVLAGGEGVEVPFSLPGPVERHFVVRVLRLGDGGAAGRRALVLYRDVTALRAADRQRADFVANVSHELRTPLAAVSGFIETLRGPARDDEEARHRFLGIMDAEARRMTRLVADLLSLSRIEATEHAAPTDPVAVAPIVARVVDALAPVARARRIAIVADLPPGLPAIAGDGDQLQQVIQNLVDNAIKYGRADGEVRVSARALADEGGAPARVAIAVADTGEGISREHLHRLTERFYRVDPGRSRRLGGTGLGLAIVKHIVNRHRGTLSIESEPGRGSVFTVRIPALPGPAASRDDQARQAP